MAIVHISELTFHKIMNRIENEDPKIPEAELVAKTRERITNLLEKYAEGV